MFKRVLWFTVGAGVGVFALLKAREYLARATPSAVQERMVEAGSGLGERASEFAASVRAAMAEREVELRDAVGLSEAREPDLGAPRRAADL